MRWNIRSLLLLAFISLLIIILLRTISFAATGDVGTVGDTAVIVPWGSYLVAFVEPLRELFVTVFTGLALWLLAKGGPMVVMMISERLVEDTLRKWFDFGIAATEGAIGNKSFSFEIGSKTVANTLNRAQDRSMVSGVSKWVLKQAGGEREVANKLIRMMPIEANIKGDLVAQAGYNMARENRTEIRVEDRAMGNNS